VDKQKIGFIDFKSGDSEARQAISDLRQRMLDLESLCGVHSQSFLPIESLRGASVKFEDEELRRAILDLRVKIKNTKSKIDAQRELALRNVLPDPFMPAPNSDQTAPLEEERRVRKEEENKRKEAEEKVRFYLNAQLEEERRLRKEAEDKVRLSQEANQVKPNSLPNVAMGKRIALVIGNAKYLSSPLRNPINDANDMSNALKQSGFEVIDVRDANLQQMRSAVRNFGDRLINNDVGLVYYSGHGIESKGRNYFIPVNSDIQRDDEIADQGLDVSLILDKMTTAGKGVNILIVDACRNDPFSRSFRSTSKGLVAMDAPKGTIIAYSTSPGKVASDGDPKARNSPYTKHLLSAIQVPNRPIEMVFKEVRRNVQNDTKNDQTPWENTSLSGDFYFRIQN
jgi:hypothetical protein